MIGAALALMAAVAQHAVKLTDIRMQLFYEATGRLSPDLTQALDGFVGRNVIIGEGDAEILGSFSVGIIDNHH